METEALYPAGQLCGPILQKIDEPAFFDKQILGETSTLSNQMIKDILKRLARNYGVNIVSIDHLGVDVELDLVRLTASDPVRNIFDVGGNFGQSALKFASAFPNATIFTFEPVPQTFKRLQNAVMGNQRIKSFNTAIGDAVGSIRINITENAGSNTILQNQTTSASVEVPINTIDSFAGANAVESIDLLKIDVEGYELQVLKGADRILKNKGVRYVYAECVLPEDTVVPHTPFADLDRVLSGYGFCFVAYYGEGFRLSDGCALGNILYALKSKLPKTAAGQIKNIV